MVRRGQERELGPLERFELLFHRHNVAAFRRPLHGPKSILYTMPMGSVLNVDRSLPPVERNETIAFQLGHLELCHRGFRFLDAAGPWKHHDDAQARHWAARYLIPDSVLERARREGWELARVAEACEVPVSMVHRRLSMLLGNGPVFLPVGVQNY